MFFDTESRRIQVDDRIEALRRDHPAGTSALGRTGGRLTAALRLPFAAAELEAAPKALPGAVNPAHVGAAAPAGLDLRHLANLRRRPDAPCYTRPAGRRSSVG